MQATETSDGWTDAETLLLLEAVALYGEKWQAVGAHVGSKNQLQCVTRFLTLPSDEALVDALERPDLRPTRVLPPSDAPLTGRHGAHASCSGCSLIGINPNAAMSAAASGHRMWVMPYSDDSLCLAGRQVRRLQRCKGLCRFMMRVIPSWRSWRSSPPCSAPG